MGLFQHIPTLQASPHADCVAICDLDADRLGQVGDQFSITGRYRDVTDMVQAERLDGVIVATPHVAHRIPAVAALTAGPMLWSKSRWRQRARMRGPFMQRPGLPGVR